jgi:PAS domain S-box-containing protein
VEIKMKIEWKSLPADTAVSSHQDSDKAYLQLLIEHSPIAIVILNSLHQAEHCNPTFVRMFGYTPGEIVNRNFDELIAFDDTLDEARRCTRSVLHGEKMQLVTRRRRKDGVWIDVDIHGIPLIVDGVLRGVYGLHLPGGRPGLWSHGRHNIRAGYEFERQRFDFADDGPRRGEIVFLTFSDFLLGQSGTQNGSGNSNIFLSYGIAGDLTKYFRAYDMSSFVQDDFKIRPNLTLNFGLRWEINSNIGDSHGRLHPKYFRGAAYYSASGQDTVLT